MRIVTDLPWTPHRCAVVPHVSPQTTGVTFIDTGQELPRLGGGHIYVSDVAVRQMMSLLGYKVPVEVEALEAQVADQEETIIRLMDQIAEQDKVIEAADVLKDWRAEKAAA